MDTLRSFIRRVSGFGANESPDTAPSPRKSNEGPLSPEFAKQEPRPSLAREPLKRSSREDATGESTRKRPAEDHPAVDLDLAKRQRTAAKSAEQKISTASRPRERKAKAAGAATETKAKATQRGTKGRGRPAKSAPKEAASPRKDIDIEPGRAYFVRLTGSREPGIVLVDALKGGNVKGRWLYRQSDVPATVKRPSIISTEEVFDSNDTCSIEADTVEDDCGICVSVDDFVSSGRAGFLCRPHVLYYDAVSTQFVLRKKTPRNKKDFVNPDN